MTKRTTAAELAGIRDCIRADLERLGLSQSELARRLQAKGHSTTQSAISRMLAASPSSTELMLIAILRELGAAETRGKRVRSGSAVARPE